MFWFGSVHGVSTSLNCHMLVVDSLSEVVDSNLACFQKIIDKPGDYMRAENIIHNYTLIVLICEIHNTGCVM